MTIPNPFPRSRFLRQVKAPVWPALMGAMLFCLLATPVANAQYALHFDGEDDYVEAGSGIDLAGKSFMIEFWANRASIGHLHTAVGQGSAEANKGLRIGFRTNNRFTFSFRENDLDTPQTWTESGWHHWACVYDHTTGNRRIYRDGELMAEDTAPAHYQGTGPLFIGKFSTGNYFHGRIDELRIWLTARSQEEIKAALQVPLTDESGAAAYWMRGNETGLAAYWRFDEGSGLTATVSGPDDRTAALTNMDPVQAWVAGIVHDLPLPGQLALRFFGEEGKYVEVMDEAPFDITDGLTLEAWVKVDTWNRAHQTILSKGAWVLRRYQETDKIVFVTSGLTPASLVSTASLMEGRWYHVAAVYDGSGKYLYIDGKLDSKTTDLTGILATNDRKVWIGDHPATGDRPFNGVLDEVRIWNVARSETLIAENYNRRLRGHEAGLVGYWTFDVPDPAYARDSSEGDHHGKLIGMTLRNFVDNPEVSLREPFSGTYAFHLDGADDHVEIPHSEALEPESLTIEAWVKPEGTGWRTILMKGSYGYGLSIDGENKLRFWLDDKPQNTLSSSDALVNGQWQHVAVVIDPVHDMSTFYIMGKESGSYTEATFNTQEGNGPLYFGREGSGCSDCNYYEGWLYQVTLWNHARSSGEINYFMNRAIPVGTSGLIGLWDFGQAAGQKVPELSGKAGDGDIINAGISGIGESGLALTGADLPSGLNLGGNPEAAGLWIGQIEINKVSEVRGDTDTPTAASHPFDMRILLHVDAFGQVRLLRDVTLMQTKEKEADGTVRKVLITDDTRLSDFEGVVRRDGKLAGIRLGSLAYDFDPERNELPLIGGVGSGFSAAGTLTLDMNHPTNPFRHKYHPDHKEGKTITRDIILTFKNPDDDKPGAGLFRLEGTYSETVSGLYKGPLRLEGTVSMERVSVVDRLNE